MKYKILLPVLLSVIVITACAQEADEKEGSEASSYTIQDSVGEVATTEAATETTSYDTDSDSLYESFLSNETKVHMSMDNDLGNYYYNFENVKGKDFTLEELVNILIEEHSKDGENIKVRLGKISYSYIDCGNDGRNELALDIYTPTETEYWEHYLIIKENEGILYTVFSDISWSRSSLYINEYGYVFGNTSSGAAYHDYEKSYVDASGRWHYIYSDFSSANLVAGGYGGDLWFNGDVHLLPEDLELDGDYAFLQFDFANTIEDDSDDVYSYGKIADTNGNDFDNGIRGYFYADFVDDDSIYDEEHPLKQFFDKEGLHIYSLQEIDEMITRRELEVGATEEIKNGNIVEWKKLDYGFEPYIPALNTDNFLNIKEFFPISFVLCDGKAGDTSFNIETEGEMEGHYSGGSADPDGSRIEYYNDFTGKFEVSERVSDTMYDLVLFDYKLGIAVGETKTTYNMAGNKFVSHSAEAKGFEDGGTHYRLYCPGTKINEIDEVALRQLPEHFFDSYFYNDELTTYILYETEGKKYVWWCSSFFYDTSVLGYK